MIVKSNHLRITQSNSLQLTRAVALILWSGVHCGAKSEIKTILVGVSSEPIVMVLFISAILICSFLLFYSEITNEYYK